MFNITCDIDIYQSIHIVIWSHSSFWLDMCKFVLLLFKL